MGLLADAKATLLDAEFAKKDALPLCALAIGISAVCVAMAVSIGAAALNAVTGLSGALIALFAAKFGLIDRKLFKQILDKQEKKDD